ncbi:MAG: NAD(P)-dependent oxidoreductase [Spirochaetia bacterium]|jgi:D-3-phosphoglycerate dehydrogenase|nr:NAD(P)-dependent oxidoreductase [Spirochaetia bacterium]
MTVENDNIRVLILKKYEERVFNVIKGCFPSDWIVTASPPGDELQEREILSCDVLIPENSNVTAQMIESAKKLKIIQSGAGYDNIDLVSVRSKGIIAANAPGVNSKAVAEHVFAFLLTWFKRIAPLDAEMKSGTWSREKKGRSLEDMTIGIAGYGNIGKRVAQIASAFGMRILVFSRNPVNSPASIKIERVDKDALMRESDVITLHLASTAETKGFIGKKELSKMKKNALLINTARGNLVDEDALINALEKKMIGGAALDVFKTEPLPPGSRLRELDNVLLSPHTAGEPDYISSYKKRFTWFYENIKKILEGDSDAVILK